MRFLQRRENGLSGSLLALGVAAALVVGVNGVRADTKLPDEAAIRASAPKEATFVYAVPSVTTTLDYQPYEGDANRFVDIPLQSKLILYDPTKLPGQGC